MRYEATSIQPAGWWHRLTHRHVVMTKDGLGSIWLCTNRLTHQCHAVYQPEGHQDAYEVPTDAIRDLVEQPTVEAAIRYLTH